MNPAQLSKNEVNCISVCIVDDDDSIRKSISRLIQAEGWHLEAFASATDFIHSNCLQTADCIVIDVNMPELTGLELHKWMLDHDFTLPVIFLTGYGDVPTSVHAMKQGAADFLVKPAENEALVEAIRRAIFDHATKRMEWQEQSEIKALHASLTAREQQVMEHVIQGRMNKQIAADLEISLKTVKVHRARALKKMGVRSVARLVHLCEKAGISRS
jgi:FixJ family two-component response regulator